MKNENTFLVKYGLNPYVRHGKDDGRSTFTIHAAESPTMICHATSLIVGHYGADVAIQVS